jgi:hypothetical protein
MALGSTQPLTEMSTRNIPGGEGRPARKADSLTAICEPIAYKMWEPQHLTTQWVLTVRDRDTFTPYLALPYAFIKFYRKRTILEKYSHVSGVCMTNDNGFRIRWLDLLELLYNQSQL